MGPSADAALQYIARPVGRNHGPQFFDGAKVGRLALVESTGRSPFGQTGS